MNLSIVSSAFCSSDGRSREGEGWVRVVDARARRRAIAANAPVASGRRFVDARERALSASSTHLAGNGERSVHIEQGEGLPGLLALRHRAFLTRACCGCDFDATDVLFRTAGEPGRRSFSASQLSRVHSLPVVLPTRSAAESDGETMTKYPYKKQPIVDLSDSEKVTKRFRAVAFSRLGFFQGVDPYAGIHD